MPTIAGPPRGSRAPPAVSRSGTLARQVQERQLDDGRVDTAAVALDGPFDGEARAGLLVGRRHGGETDRLLENRAPAVARDLADLAIAAPGEHRDRGAVHGGGDGRRQALPRECGLDSV